ncbi:MAG: prephenate dehydrogenase/arogenate dehydrogenase family protein [Clostridia bacterium]|nr:prephenate dehydrogenase/arogenate dehydrogenase family protein [Clostridia bacterium]
MIIGIAGLGLIGGSLAKAYKRNENCRVLGYDLDSSVNDFAILSEAIDEKLTPENIKTCDLVLVAIYPAGAAEYLKENAPLFSKDTVVMDCVGIKDSICRVGFELAKEYGFTFVGGHPMAGTQNGGLKYAREDLFDDAPMVIVPPKYDDIGFLDKIKNLLAPVRFGSISVTTAEEHDRVIAFTSQLAHVVSNAYIKSPTALSHKGVSAGSYKDLTRVAWLNPEMWADLFLGNSQHLAGEIDFLINSLTEYKKAIEECDRQTLIKILDEGRKRKKEVDG